VRNTVKTLLVLTMAVILTLLVRATALTICCVEGKGLQPVFLAGDRVMVNRWSYGLRVGGNSVMGYNRLWRSPVQRGDVVAVNDPTDTLQSSVDARRVLFLRCRYVPGDSIHTAQGVYQVPGRYNCADADYYLMTPLGQPAMPPVLISETHIIGRAFLVIYSHDPEQPLWHGWRSERCCMQP